jgi:hypothetical protein
LGVSDTPVVVLDIVEPKTTSCPMLCNIVTHSCLNNWLPTSQIYKSGVVSLRFLDTVYVSLFKDYLEGLF